MVKTIGKAIKIAFLSVISKLITVIKAISHGTVWLISATFIDFVGILGLLMLWYGLNLFNESLAFSVVGGLLILYAVKATK